MSIRSMSLRSWLRASSLRHGVLVLAVFALFVAASCGGSDAGSGGVASLGGGNEKGGEAASDRGSKSWEEAAVDFAECMRKEGVDMPDPSTEGDGPGGFAITPDTDLGATEQEFRAADKACRHLLEDARPPELSDEEEQKVREDALAFTRCMREHGIDMPDPRFGEDGSVSVEVGDPGSDMDPSDPSPEFERAQEACSEYDPLNGGGDR